GHGRRAAGKPWWTRRWRTSCPVVIGDRYGVREEPRESLPSVGDAGPCNPWWRMDEGVPIVTDWGTRPRGIAASPPGPGTPGAAAGWSDALADRWRDPASPAAVVITPAASGAPALESDAAAPDGGPRRGLGLVLLVSVITALLAGALGGTLGFVFASRGNVGTGTRLGTGGTAAPLTPRPPNSLADVVRRVLPSWITVKRHGTGGTSVGSGVIVSSDGYAITNDHVVTGASGSASVTFSDGNTVAAKVVGTDPESDVAVLKLEADRLTPIAFGDSDAVQVGDPVLA